MIPPIPWQAKTSNVSSNRFKNLLYIQMLETIAVIKPKKILSGILTNPAAGVIATKPTTQPMQAPRAEILRPLILSKNIQVIIPIADAADVVANAFTAVPSAASEDPALNPNHPTKHPVPNNTMECL